MDLTPIPSQTVGPYFHLGCTTTHSFSCLAGPNAKGERVRLFFRVIDGDSVPVDDSMIEIWQADSSGRYNHPADSQNGVCESDCSGFGRLATDKNGMCVFETVKPGRVLANDGTLQAPHLNVSVFARGVMKRLATRVYFAGDPANSEDFVLALVPEGRRVTLMALPESPNAGDWYFAVHLCGRDETVFFDV